MREPLWHTRPFSEPYDIRWSWQPMNGADMAGKVHTFFMDALSELCELAEVRVDFDKRLYSVLGGSWRIRPVHTIFNSRMGFPHSFATLKETP